MRLDPDVLTRIERKAQKIHRTHRFSYRQVIEAMSENGSTSTQLADLLGSGRVTVRQMLVVLQRLGVLATRKGEGRSLLYVVEIENLEVLHG